MLLTLHPGSVAAGDRWADVCIGLHDDIALVLTTIGDHVAIESFRASEIIERGIALMPEHGTC